MKLILGVIKFMREGIAAIVLYAIVFGLIVTVALIVLDIFS